MAYVPPHRRRSGDAAAPPPPASPQAAASPPWVSLESLVTPDDSVSVVAGRVTTPLADLTEAEVGCVLHNLGLGKYAELCLRVPLRGRDLAHCTEDDLKEIGIGFRPHRLSLLEEVAVFVENGVPADLLVLLDGAIPPPSQQPPARPMQPPPPPPATATDDDAVQSGEATAAVAAAQSGDDGCSSAPTDTPTWIKSAEAHVRTLPQPPSVDDDGAAHARADAALERALAPSPPASDVSAANTSVAGSTEAGTARPARPGSVAAGSVATTAYPPSSCYALDTSATTRSKYLASQPGKPSSQPAPPHGPPKQQPPQQPPLPPQPPPPQPPSPQPPQQPQQQPRLAQQPSRSRSHDADPSELLSALAGLSLQSNVGVSSRR